jgi:hypothetical protein
MFFTFNELFLMLSVLYKYKKFQQEISSPWYYKSAFTE